jgi:hypothetical protein
MTARHQVVAVFTGTVLVFAGLSIVIPGPIAVHWNGTDTTRGTIAPTWIIGIAIVTLMTATGWAYRHTLTAVPILVAEAAFGILFVIVTAAFSNTAVLGALLVAALGSALSYVGAAQLPPPRETCTEDQHLRRS